jgi:hypothetical protein
MSDSARSLRWRVTGAVAVTAVVAVAAALAVVPRAHAATPRFAPYLLATQGNAPDLVGASRNTGAKVINLGFVIGLGGRCIAAWDGTVPLRSRPFAGRVTALRAAGGDVQISFGGQGGVDLSRACKSDAALAGEYLAAIRAYNAKRIDVDIEGSALANRAGALRMVRALALVRRKRPGLHVVLTVPVEPSGLGVDVLAILRAARAGKVHFDVVNIMTMDYGPAFPAPAPGGATMFSYAENAAIRTVRQLNAASPRAGGWWSSLGVTPMLGVNDVTTEVFTLGDARALLAFARERGLAEVAFWSVDRDGPCAKPHPQPQETCSGVAQAPFEYSSILRLLDG